MIILHGVYDNGKIEIKEKNLPQIRTEIEIALPQEKNVREENQFLFECRGKLDIDGKAIEKLRRESRV